MAFRKIVARTLGSQQKEAGLVVGRLASIIVNLITRCVYISLRPASLEVKELRETQELMEGVECKLRPLRA